MQPIPGLDPQPEPRAKGRVVIGVHVMGGGGWRVIIGLIIVGWGLLLTAANLHWDPAYHILAHWYFPTALTAVGLMRIATADSGIGRGVGGLLAALGAWWLVSEAYGIRFNIGDWWPIGLVALGVLLISRAWTRPNTVALGAGAASNWPATSASFSSDVSSEPATGGAAPAAGAVTEGGPVEAFAFWSGISRRVSAGFKRANLAAVMGGIELDLRPAIMVGDNATVEVFVLMGGLEIRLPPDWSVANQSLVIMGGIDDRSSGSSGTKKTLTIRGLVLMGGIEIKA